MGETVFLVGGGPSLEGFDFNKLKHEEVIVVNKALFDVPWAKYFITMDRLFVDKVGLMKFKATGTPKVFVANMECLVERDGLIVDPHCGFGPDGYVYDLSMFDVILKSRSSQGCGRTFKEFANGANSGFCALQFALLLGYKSICLLGYDMWCNGRTHYHEGYRENPEKFKKKLAVYKENLERSLPEICANFPGVVIHQSLVGPTCTFSPVSLEDVLSR